jgi:hypothetical protein
VARSLPFLLTRRVTSGWCCARSRASSAAGRTGRERAGKLRRLGSASVARRAVRCGVDLPADQRPASIDSRLREGRARSSLLFDLPPVYRVSHRLQQAFQAGSHPLNTRLFCHRGAAQSGRDSNRSHQPAKCTESLMVPTAIAMNLEAQQRLRTHRWRRIRTPGAGHHHRAG